MPVATRYPTNGGGIVGNAMSRAQGIKDELERQTEVLVRLEEHAAIEAEADEFTWLRSNITLDASGNGTAQLENRTGYEVDLSSFAAQLASVNANSLVAFYANSVEPPNLYWVSNAFSQFVSDKFFKGMLIPNNGALIARFIAAGAANTAWINVLARKTVHRQGGKYVSQVQGG